MSVPDRRALLGHVAVLVRLAQTPLLAVALGLLVTFTWAPLAYAGFVPQPYASGVVQPTDSSSDTVVKLDSGQYASATKVSASAGERVELFRASADSTVVGSDSRWSAVGLTAMLGTIFTIFTAGGLALLGEWLLPRLLRRVEGSLR